VPVEVKRTKYKDDFEQLDRIYYLKKLIPILQKELADLENHFANKRKVNDFVGQKEKNGYKPLLGLFNKIVYRPSAYCELKQCYLLLDDIREKSCYYKRCKHLITLEENEKKKGIKNAPMKFYDRKCEIL
jgi:hypothetical protein